MIKNIRFKIFAGKSNRIPEFYTIFSLKNARLHNKTTRSRPGRGQMFEGETEAESLRPRPKFWNTEKRLQRANYEKLFTKQAKCRTIYQTQYIVLQHK